jgi:hypothetical protein
LLSAECTSKDVFMYCFQRCFICRPSDSTVSDGIEPRTDATLTLAVRRSNHSAIDFRFHSRLDLIYTRLVLIYTRLDLIHIRLDLIQTQLDLIHSAKCHTNSDRSHPPSARSHPHSARSHPHSDIDLIHT